MQTIKEPEGGDFFKKIFGDSFFPTEKDLKNPPKECRPEFYEEIKDQSGDPNYPFK